MAYKISNQTEYTIEIENRKGDQIEITIDSTDIAQVDALVGLMNNFDKVTSSLKKRLAKAKKEYEEENVYIRQALRIMTEVFSTVNDDLDNVFGEGISEKIFLGRLSIADYQYFFEMLEKEFSPAIEKGKKSLEGLFDKYDLDKVDDDVL